MKNNIVIVSLTIILLILFVVGISFAYFSVETNNSSTNTSVDVKVEDIGSVRIESGVNLNMKLTLNDMMDYSKDIAYYATESGVLETSENLVNFAKTKVTGNGIFTCDYTLNIDYNGTMKERLTTDNTIILNVNGKDYDLYKITFPLKINGSFNNISSLVTKNINGYLKVNNLTNTNQSDIAGTNMMLLFTISYFKCSIE